ncbi:MAG: DUF2156 domain-containing protein [Ruminococcaceae bacterium]|nr:DUF2156 domain-containing protein [Oscillospiraceae bacterium]
MLTFREITLADREKLHRHFYGADGHGSEYSFVNQFVWGDQRVCFVEGNPLILSRFGSWQAYLFPLDPKYIPILRDDAAERGIPLRFWGINAQETELFDCRDFSIKKARNSFDYVYEIERLCELKGRKLQSKRNHCNRFAAENPDCRIEILTSDAIAQCREFTERWYVEHEAVHDIDYSGEKRAIKRVFDNFDALKMEGLMLFTADGLVAFCMGNRIREDMFDVNYEKALSDIHGAYPTINRAFARYIHEKYPKIRLINREDDMGLEGLRKAKESYHPDWLLEKFVAEAL